MCAGGAIAPAVYCKLHPGPLSVGWHAGHVVEGCTTKYINKNLYLLSCNEVYLGYNYVPC